MSSTALSVSVTRSEAAVLRASAKEEQISFQETGETFTIYFGVDGGGIGGGDHHAGLLGQADKEIMDFLKIGFGHGCTHISCRMMNIKNKQQSAC